MFVRLRRELKTIADLQARNLAGLTTEAAVKEWTIPLKALGRLASKPRGNSCRHPIGDLSVARIIQGQSFVRGGIL
jgi:hypothetical protein